MAESANDLGEEWHTVYAVLSAQYLKVRIEDEDRSVRIPFANPEHASIAKRVIEVDSELQAHLVKRSLEVENCELIGWVPLPLMCLHSTFRMCTPERNTDEVNVRIDRSFTCLTVRLARLSINSFLENVELVIRTLGEFGEDAVKAKQA